MWGLRGLWNFGKWGNPDTLPPSQHSPSTTSHDSNRRREKVVDEEEEMPTGLKGRWSAGGEVYFSAQERSAGLSTGLRFSTIPESEGGPPQPPTTVTATLNPIMGQLSTAYSVKTGRDSSLASRFDFNMYSYDADFTVGGEWFQRRKGGSRKGKEREVLEEEIEGGKKATFDAFGRGVEEEGGGTAVQRRKNNDSEDEITAVLKLRASTNSVSFPLLFKRPLVLRVAHIITCRTSR